MPIESVTEQLKILMPVGFIIKLNATTKVIVLLDLCIL